MNTKIQYFLVSVYYIFPFVANISQLIIFSITFWRKTSLGSFKAYQYTEAQLHSSFTLPSWPKTFSDMVNIVQNHRITESQNHRITE